MTTHNSLSPVLAKSLAPFSNERTHARTHSHRCMHTHRDIYIEIAHTHTHTHTHTYACSRVCQCRCRMLTTYISFCTDVYPKPYSMQVACCMVPEELMRLQTSCCSGHAGRSPGQLRWLPSAVAAIQKADQSVVDPAAEAPMCCAESPWRLAQLRAQPSEVLLVPVRLRGCQLCPACQYT